MSGAAIPAIPGEVDVAISGGGVAGSSLAIVLARAGMRVLVVEKETRFRDRVRGEGIHPWGVHLATKLGLLPVLEAGGAQPLPIWTQYHERRIAWQYRWADDSVGGCPEMGVHHPLVQEAAIQAATAAGAILVRPGKVTALVTGERPAIEIAAGDRTVTVRARLVVGADGRTSTIRSRAGIAVHSDPEHHRIGGGLFEQVDLDPTSAHEVIMPGGRVFVLPQGGGRVRAYVVTAPGRYLDVQRDHRGQAMIACCAERYPEGAWRAARPAGPVAFFSNGDVWAERAAPPGVALLGDAAGANDPSCGNGMSLVFRDVAELSGALLADQDWTRATAVYAERRSVYFAVLREHAKWFGVLSTEEGQAADERRVRVERARFSDPTAGGFAFIFAKGPDGLVADEAARRRFFGESG